MVDLVLGTFFKHDRTVVTAQTRKELNMPQISVIVPVYNVEHYLPACVDSILTQTFTDFELILVDDGSVDKCSTICDAYAKKDQRITVIHQQNGGLSAARNAGMDVATGEYITFIDSDDFVCDDYFKRLIQTCYETKAEISIAKLIPFIDGSHVCEQKSNLNNSVELVSGIEAVKAQYVGSKTIKVNACGKLFHNRLIAGMRFPVGKIHEDQALIPIILYQAGQIAIQPGASYYYRDRACSITGKNFSLKRYDDLWAIEKCISYFKEKKEQEIVRVALQKRKKQMCLYALYAKRNHVSIPEEYKVNTLKALLYLYNSVPNEKFDYYLSQTFPGLLRPSSYLRKMRSFFAKETYELF